MCGCDDITRPDIKLDGDILKRDIKHLENDRERNKVQIIIGEIYEGGTYYRMYRYENKERPTKDPMFGASWVDNKGRKNYRRSRRGVLEKKSENKLGIANEEVFHRAEE